MGWLRSKKTQPTEPPREEPLLDMGTTNASRDFYSHLQGGDLDQAAAVLDAYVSSMGAGAARGKSLLERAAGVALGLQRGDLESTANVLEGWESPYAAEYREPAQRARMNALGLCSMMYLRHPQAKSHPRFESILTGRFRDLAKEAHRSGEPYFGDVFASTMAEMRSR